MTQNAKLSVIIPTLNAETDLPECLQALVSETITGLVTDVIIVDAGSVDKTRHIADSMGANILHSDRGRGLQLQRGVEIAKHDWFLFLHADSVLGCYWGDCVRKHIGTGWDKAAFLRLKYRSNAPQARWLAARANRRARWFGLPYGDQGLLISRKFYFELGGFKPLPLFEDVDLVRRISRHRLTMLDCDITTSAEKYERDGWRVRAYKNTFLLARYLAGGNPEKLAKSYH